MKIIIAILALLAVAMCAQTNTVTINRNFINLQATYHYEDPFAASHGKPYCNSARENSEGQSYDGLDEYFGCMPLTCTRLDFKTLYNLDPDMLIQICELNEYQLLKVYKRTKFLLNRS